jgi:hypothetical protein
MRVPSICPVLHFSVVIFFWSFGIIDASTIKCLELSTAQAGAMGREGCCTYSLFLMYRLNQTESAILFVILLLLMLPRDHFVSSIFFMLSLTWQSTLVRGVFGKFFSLMVRFYPYFTKCNLNMCSICTITLTNKNRQIPLETTFYRNRITHTRSTPILSYLSESYRYI